MKSSNPVVQKALDARAERLACEIVTNMVRRRPVTNPVVANALRAFGVRVENGTYEVPRSVREALNAPKFGTQEYEDLGKRNGMTKDETGHYHKEGEGTSGTEGASGTPDAAEKEPQAKTTEELMQVNPGDDPKTVKMKEKLAAEHARKVEAQKGLEAAEAKRDAAKEGRDKAVEETARQGLTDDENRTMDGIMAGMKSAGSDVGMKEAAERVVSMKATVDSLPDEHPQKALAVRQVAAAEKFLDGVKQAEAEAVGDGPKGPTGPTGDPGVKGGDPNMAEDGQPIMKDGKINFDRSPEPKKAYEKGDTDFSEKAILNRGVSKEEYDAMAKIAKTEMVVGRDPDGNPITKPVSPAFHGMVTAMLCGVDVPDSTITSMPEWKEAQKKCDELESEVIKNGGVRREGNRSFVDTKQIRTRGRKRMRSDMFQTFMSDTMDERNCEAVELARDANGKKIPGKYKVVKDEDGNEVELSPYKVRQGRELHLITGLPSAGKSSVFASKLCRDLGARLTDCDAIKQKLPEFNNGLGANAIHEESSAINDAIVRKAQKRGDNIVYPMLGKKAAKIEKIKADAERNGYKVVIHYNDLPPAKAKGRLINRFLSQGRFMQPSLVSGPGLSCRQAFEEVKDKFEFAEAASNDVGKGKKPIRLFKKP